jgi:hypothetical protein
VLQAELQELDAIESRVATEASDESFDTRRHRFLLLLNRKKRRICALETALESAFAHASDHESNLGDDADADDDEEEESRHRRATSAPRSAVPGASVSSAGGGTTRRQPAAPATTATAAAMPPPPQQHEEEQGDILDLL